MNWLTLHNEEQLNEILKASLLRPQIIFKHSTSCSISAMAKARLDRDNGVLEKYDTYYLDLLRYRSISNEISEKFGVHHESPQIIVLNKGEVTYDESHLDISVDEILEHFQFLQN